MRFLVAIGASLRFSDCQHVRWSTHAPAFSHFVEYATGLRQCAEEPRRGCSVLAAFLFGKLGHDVAPKVAVVDGVWSSLKTRFGDRTNPDWPSFS